MQTSTTTFTPHPHGGSTLCLWTQRLPKHRGNSLRLRLTPHVVAGPVDCWPEWRQQWQQVLQQSTKIVSVEIVLCDMDEMELEMEGRLHQLVADFGYIPNLKSFKIQGCCFTLPVKMVSQLLEQANQLIKLHLAWVKLTTTKEPTDDLDVLTAAFSRHSSLRELRIQDSDSIPNRNCTEKAPVSLVDSILYGAATSSSLECLYFSSSMPNSLGSISASAIQQLKQSQKLRTLCFHEMDAFFQSTTDNAMSPLDAMANLLISNDTRLTCVHIPFQRTKSHCQTMYQILCHNTTLQGLSLEGGIPSEGDDVHHLHFIANGLRQNTTIQQFALLGMASRIRQSPELRRAFAHVLQHNYTLQTLHVADLWTDGQYREVVDFWAQLNVKGRQQWMEDVYNNHASDSHGTGGGGGVEKQLQLLEQLADDTDSVFYYLTEIHPWLIGSLVQY